MATPRESNVVSFVDSDGSSVGTPRRSITARRRSNQFTEAAVAEDGGDENVKVCVRVRPFNHREEELQKANEPDKAGGGVAPLRSVVEMPEGLGGRVIFHEKVGQEYKFTEEFQYTKSFWSIPEEQQPHTYAPITQEDVFDVVGRPIIRYAFAGFHNCVFAYGQTGSGKTHSMMGHFEGTIVPLSGLIPRLCVELFERAAKDRESSEEGILKTVEVKLSAVEIYNEQVRDLLWKLSTIPGRTKNTVLKIRKHPADGSFFVDQLTVVTPKTWLECLKFIDKAVSERTVAATDMNDESSRSHCIFQLTLEQTETIHVVSEDDPEGRYTKPVTNKKISKINLVDLAGSERLKKSHAQGQQLKEAAGINLSLTTLKKVIDALVVNSKEINPKKHVLIPFRESSLTLLLSDSLGGNSKTTMIACVSPHYDNQEETHLTLRYANRTGAIVNHARVNEDSAAKQALKLKHEILELQRRLAEGPVDEEADELQEQIELGKRTLKDMEEESKRAARAADELRVKSRREEEAIVSSAFYNTLRMVLLEQQKEQMESGARDMEQQITQHKDEVQQLTQQVEEKDVKEKAHMRLIDSLQRSAHINRIKESEQDRHAAKLADEAADARRKMDREVELRYGQRIVAAYRIRKARAAAQLEVEQLQQEQEDKLTLVIMEAAGQYEQQVRQFADTETVVHQRTTQIEKEVRRLNSEREEAERSAAKLMSEMRVAEKAHAERIHTQEAEWKVKYEIMKNEYEAKISSMDELIFTEQRQQDAQLQGIDREATHEQEEAIMAVTRDIRESESKWNIAVTQLVEERAEEMESATRERVRYHALQAAKRRRELEGQIADCAQKLFRLQGVLQEHDDCITYLEKATAPITPYFDTLRAEVPIRYGTVHSAKYNQLRSLLARFDGTIQSNKVITPSSSVLRDTPAAAAAAATHEGEETTPQRNREIEVSVSSPLGKSAIQGLSPVARFFDPTPKSDAGAKLSQRLRGEHEKSNVSQTSTTLKTPLRSTTPSGKLKSTTTSASPATPSSRVMWSGTRR